MLQFLTNSSTGAPALMWSKVFISICIMFVLRPEADAVPVRYDTPLKLVVAEWLFLRDSSIQSNTMAAAQGGKGDINHVGTE